MGLFNRKRKEDLRVEATPTSRVEVEVHKTASEQAVKKAKEANEHLKELLVQNGFTLKIYLAAHNPAPNNKRGKNR
jgi:hypothetical protein